MPSWVCLAISSFKDAECDGVGVGDYGHQKAAELCNEPLRPVNIAAFMSINPGEIISLFSP